jgi:hypothetical protein
VGAIMEVGGGASSAVGVTAGVTMTGVWVIAELHAVRRITSNIRKCIRFIVIW